MIKYEILEDKKIEYNGKFLCKIKALKDFANVKKGDLGGYIEDYNNLSQRSNCWIFNNAKVYDNARICENARVYEDAEVYENAEVFKNAKVYDNAKVYGNAKVYENAGVYENAMVFENAKVYGYAKVHENAKVYGNAEVYGYAEVFGYTMVSNNTIIGKVCCNFDKIFEIQNPKGRLVTGILKDDEIYYSVGCQINITEEEFRYRIENTNRGIEYNPHRLEYYKIIDMIKLYFGK